MHPQGTRQHMSHLLILFPLLNFSTRDIILLIDIILQQLCGFNPPSTIDTTDSTSGPIMRDTRKIFGGGSSNESGGDVTRGAVGDVMTNRSSQKRSLKAVKDCIEHLQVGAFRFIALFFLVRSGFVCNKILLIEGLIFHLVS